MSLVTESSPVTALPQLDFYTKSPVQTSIETTYSDEVRPLAQLNTGGHIEFNIHNGYNEYVNLQETTLYVKFKVNLKRTDNQAVTRADWSKVSVVNNFLHSLWSQIDLTIGDTQITSALQTYSYRAYFEAILGSTQHVRDTHLLSTLFTEDDMKNQNVPDNNRKKYICPKEGETALTSGKIVEVEGKLHLDLFLQHRAMIGGTKLKLKLVPNRPEFYFMVSDDKLIPRIEFLDIHLNVTKFRCSEEVVLAQLQALNVSPAKYIINRSEVRTFTIDSGATSRNIENVINGQLPRRVYVAFVSNEAYSGSLKLNPFYLYHYGINSITCFVNGEQYPRKAYTPDFDNELCIRPFLELYRVAEQLNNDARMLIKRDNYSKGYCIFPFNLSVDHSQGYNSAGYVNLPRKGVLRFEIHFAAALNTNINAVVFCEFDNQLNIAEDRNAFMDYR